MSAPHKQPANILRSGFLGSFYFPSNLLQQFLPEPTVLATSVSRPAPPLKSQSPASPGDQGLQPPALLMASVSFSVGLSSTCSQTLSASETLPLLMALCKPLGPAPFASSPAFLQDEPSSSPPPAPVYCGNVPLTALSMCFLSTNVALGRCPGTCASLQSLVRDPSSLPYRAEVTLKTCRSPVGRCSHISPSWPLA